MKGRGPWIVFAIALVLVGAIMGWVTTRLVGVEHERLDGQWQAAHEEDVRLALWRLDSAATPLLSQEIAAVGLIAEAPDAVATLPRPDEVRARFVLRPGESPQVLGASEAAIAELATLVTGADFFARLPEPTAQDGRWRLDNPVAKVDRGLEIGMQENQSEGALLEARNKPASQKRRSTAELAMRNAAVEDNLASYGWSLENALDSAQAIDGKRGAEQTHTISLIAAGPARPLWVGDALVLARRVQTGDGTAIHGSFIDWPALRGRLLAEIDDTLPQADLIPVDADGAEAFADRMLATLPVRLFAEPIAARRIDALGVLLPSLVLGWAGMLVAAIAVFALLRWSLALSERRAAFVSAVTHELRTPLTTFRMYAEMLSEGMVDDAKRTRYLLTLRREADRLGDLVENVLAYSRIESDKAPLAPETMTPRALIDRVRDRLQERATRAGLALAIELPDSVADMAILVDPTAAEQILFNLVDNAAKYGPSESDPTIVVYVRDAGARIEICVRDHGPGIPQSERESIFAPFAKGAAQSAGTQPGVGLGLSLARRLARQLRGDLTVEAADPGARFVLSLPRA